MIRSRVGWGASLLGLAALLAAAAGCGDDDSSSPEEDSGAGDAGDDGGGDDGGPDSGRGDPADFPEECIEECQEACDAIADCDAGAHPEFPLDPEGCMERCALAMVGPYWDDVSVNFRCCASQEDCPRVWGCGGWLAHPDTIGPCEDVCSLMASGSPLGELWAGAEAPEGYRFAPSTILVRRSDRTVDWDAAYGAQLTSDGAIQVVSFRRTVTPARASDLFSREDVLPTFVDGAGRIAAAIGRIVVVAEDEEAIGRASEVAESSGLGAPRRLRFGDGLYAIDGDDAWWALEVLPHLDAIPGVDAELDMLRIHEHRWAPNDPLFADQWHLLNEGQDGLPLHGVDARVSEAWDLTATPGHPDAVIAILDNGVDIHHPDLADNLLEPHNYHATWEQDIALGFGSHGTCCAGVAAAIADNGEGCAGVCPGCTVLPALLAGAAGFNPVGFMVTDVETADLFVDLVDMGAWIISNSWGPAGEDPMVESSSFPSGPLPTVVANAFSYAETTGRGGLGTLILFAAGNSNQDATADAYVSYDDVVAVAALDDQGLKSYYSNWGEKIDVAAPSNGGLAGITTVSAGTDSATDPGYTDSFGGTSSACPFAAGVAGLVLSAAPGLTAAEVRDVLAASAERVDPVWGEWEDGFSPYYGHGLVNAYRAVKMALGECATPEECDAPSDVCTEGCDGETCDPCRTDADCADGHACQALPALGGLVCVAEEGGSGCEDGLTSAGGYCIPDRETCGLCGGDEVCNGRDDDCDGQVDEDLECEGSARCLQAAEGCPDGMGCAATLCRDACTYNADCEDGLCKAVKDRYGEIHLDRAVCHGGTGECELGCQVLASSLEDEELTAFLDCVDEASGWALFECMQYLPIEFDAPGP